MASVVPRRHSRIRNIDEMRWNDRNGEMNMFYRRIILSDCRSRKHNKYYFSACKKWYMFIINNKNNDYENCIKAVIIYTSLTLCQDVYKSMVPSQEEFFEVVICEAEVMTYFVRCWRLLLGGRPLVMLRNVCCYISVGGEDACTGNEIWLKKLSRLMTKPTKGHVRPLKT